MHNQCRHLLLQVFWGVSPVGPYNLNRSGAPAERVQRVRHATIMDWQEQRCPDVQHPWLYYSWRLTLGPRSSRCGSNAASAPVQALSEFPKVFGGQPDVIVLGVNLWDLARWKVRRSL